MGGGDVFQRVGTACAKARYQQNCEEQKLGVEGD